MMFPNQVYCHSTFNQTTLEVLENSTILQSAAISALMILAESRPWSIVLSRKTYSC